MGKYADPAMFVNKQFETLNKGLTDLYGNVAKNAELIRKREEAKKLQAAKRMEAWGKIYSKGTEENYQGALDFTQAMPKNSTNTIEFTDKLKTVYKQGYDNIANMVASGATDGEIMAYVQDQINAANTFTEGIVAFDNFQQTYNAGVESIGKQPGKYKGNKAGDVVVGSQYDQTFTALGMDPDAGNPVPLEKLKMVGDINTGIKFFYDKNNDGDLSEGEVLDLNAMAGNFAGGKNPYFKEVEDFTELAKGYKAQLDNLEKAPAFVREMSVTDADGTTRKVTHVDRKKRQDYFLNSNTAGGKLIDEMIRSKDLTMLAQSIGGYKFAQKFNGNDPVQMKMLKIGLIEKLAPSLFPGSEKLGPSSFGSKTTSMQFEDKDPAIETITDFTMPIHETILDYAVGYDVNKLQKYKGRPYRQGSDATDRGIIDSIIVPKSNEPHKIRVKYVGNNGNLTVGTIIDMSTDEGRALFEANIVNGNFPKAKRTRIMGIGKAVVGGYEYDDSKTTTRITKREGAPSLSIEEFDEQIQGSTDVIKFDDLYDGWSNQWAGPSPADTPTNVQQQDNENVSVDTDAATIEVEQEQDDQTVVIDYNDNNAIVDSILGDDNDAIADEVIGTTSGQVSDDDDYVTNRILYMSQPQDTRAYGIDDDGNEISFEKDSEEFLRNIEVTYGGYEDGGTKGLPSYGGNDKRIDQHLNSKNKIGEYFDGSDKKGLKADIGEDVYNNLSDANKAILRMEHLNVGWNPKVIMLQTAGIISDAERGAYHRGDKDVNALYEQHKNEIASKLKGKDAQLLKNLESTYKGTQNHEHNDQTAKLVDDFNKGKDSKGNLIPLTYEELGELAKKDTKKGKAAKIEYDKITAEGKKRDKGYQAQYTRRIADIKKHYQIK